MSIPGKSLRSRQADLSPWVTATAGADPEIVTEMTEELVAGGSDRAMIAEAETTRGTQMRKSFLGILILATALGLTACAGGGEPPGPRFAQVAAQLPPVPPDRARFFFYRDYSLYDSLQRPEITMNGQPVAISEIGGVTYRDMPPGTYLIDVPYSAIYPYKDKTVTAAGGQTVYVKIQSNIYEPNITLVDYEQDIFVVVLVDPSTAQQEIASKRYFP
jgi:hypothetical protein